MYWASVLYLIAYFFLADRFQSPVRIRHTLTKFCPPLLLWAKDTALWHGIPWSIALLSAKTAEAQWPIGTEPIECAQYTCDKISSKKPRHVPHRLPKALL